MCFSYLIKSRDASDEKKGTGHPREYNALCAPHTTSKFSAFPITKMLVSISVTFDASPSAVGKPSKIQKWCSIITYLLIALTN